MRSIPRTRRGNSDTPRATRAILFFVGAVCLSVMVSTTDHPKHFSFPLALQSFICRTGGIFDPSNLPSVDALACF
jgi:hypothetical protein